MNIIDLNILVCCVNFTRPVWSASIMQYKILDKYKFVYLTCLVLAAARIVHGAFAVYGDIWGLDGMMIPPKAVAWRIGQQVVILLPLVFWIWWADRLMSCNSKRRWIVASFIALFLMQVPINVICILIGTPISVWVR